MNIYELNRDDSAIFPWWYDRKNGDIITDSFQRQIALTAFEYCKGYIGISVALLNEDIFYAAEQIYAIRMGWAEDLLEWHKVYIN